MRRIHPAITAGISAAMIMGAGTAAIVGIDTALNGDMPWAIAAHGGEVNVSCTNTTVVGEDGYNVTKNDDDTFEATGKLTLTARNGQTGPFHATLTIPANWAERGATIDGDLTVTPTTMPDGGTVTVTKAADGKSIDVKVTGGGLTMSESSVIEIGYKLKTAVQDLTVEVPDDNQGGQGQGGEQGGDAGQGQGGEQGGDTGQGQGGEQGGDSGQGQGGEQGGDSGQGQGGEQGGDAGQGQGGEQGGGQTGPTVEELRAQKIAEIKQSLTDMSWGIRTLEYDTDWTEPAAAIDMTWQDDPFITVSGSTADVPPSKSATGTITVRFTGNTAGAKLSTPTLTGDAASAMGQLEGGTVWTLYHGDEPTGETLESGTAHDFMANDKAVATFTVRVNSDASVVTPMANHSTATVTAKVSATGTPQDGGSGTPLDEQTKTATVGIRESKVTVGSITATNKTNPGTNLTMGDEAEVVVPVSSGNGYVPAGQKVRIAIGNTNMGGVKFTGANSTDCSVSSDGKYVDITLGQMDPNTTTTYKLTVVCGTSTDTSLDGKTASINSDVAMFGATPKDAATIAAITPPAVTIGIVAPKATISTQATDPNVQVQDEQSSYAEEITTNLSDTARFKVTFKNSSDDRVIKKATFEDSLSAVDAEGNALDNTSQACIDILASSVTLTRRGANNTPEVIPATVTLTPSALADHPASLKVIPNQPLDLAPGEEVTLTYDAQMGHTDIRTSNLKMRGATVKNNPTMAWDNKTGAASIESATPATVNIATAQITATLSADPTKFTKSEKTTYMATVRSIENNSDTMGGEYAIGLHFTSILDDYSRSFGYKFDKDSVKLYHVSGGSPKEIPSSDYDFDWIVPDEGSDTLKEMSFVLDIKSDKAALYKIKSVQVSEPNLAKSVTEASAQNSDVALNGTEARRAQATANAQETDGDGSGADGTAASVPEAAQEIKEGFIITYDGTTKYLNSKLTGSLDAKTDILVRADNAGYCVATKKVTIVGDEAIIPQTDWKDPTQDPTAAGQGNNASQNGKNAQNAQNRNNQNAPLTKTGIDAPASFLTILAGIAGLIATQYHKIRKR